MRHISGLTYPTFGNSLVNLAYGAANVFDPRQSLSEFVTKVSKLPLAYEPGTTWDYGLSTDVLGRIVEVVSGVPLDKFFAGRIVKPLHLMNTGFFAPASNAGRIAQPQIESAGPYRRISTGMFLAPRLKRSQDRAKLKSFAGYQVFSPRRVIGIEATFYNAAFFKRLEPGGKCVWANSRQ